MLEGYDLAIVILLFTATLVLVVIAWGVLSLIRNIKALQASTIAIASTTHELQKESMSELTRARLRIR